MRTGLHHTGVGLKQREGEVWFESPTESGFDSPAIMVPISLPKQECLTDEYLICMDQDEENEVHPLS